MSEDVRLAKSDLTGFAAAIFAAAGVEPAMAATWAQGVVWANLRGVDSHGVIRIPRYVDLLKKKSINPRPAMKVERRAGAIAVLDADRAPGVDRHDAGDGRGDRLRQGGAYRLVRGAQRHPCGRHRVFRAAGGAPGHGRHRDDGVGAADGLSRGARRRRVDQPDRDRGSGQEAPAPACSTCRPRRSPTARCWPPRTRAIRCRSAGASTRRAATPPIRRRSRRCCRWADRKARACR